MTNDLQPLRPLTLEAQDGSKHAFRPQADMTPLESVLISQLFIRMVMSVWNGPVDWPTYVEEHKLERHFTLVETPLMAVPYREVYTGTSKVVVEPEPEMIRTESGGIISFDAPPPRLVRYAAAADIANPAAGSRGWKKGDVLTLLEGMPVPDGFVPVIEYEDLGRRDGSTRSAG